MFRGSFLTRRAGGPCRTRRRSRSRRCGEGPGRRRGLAQPNASPGGNGGVARLPHGVVAHAQEVKNQPLREAFACVDPTWPKAPSRRCTRMSASFRAVRSKRRFMASSASWLAREPERTGRRCRIAAPGSIAVSAPGIPRPRTRCFFPPRCPPNPMCPWKTDEPATLDAAGAELGEPSGSRNQQAHIPSGARRQPMCGCGVSGVLRRNLRRRTRSPARRRGRHPQAFARHRRPRCPYP